MQFDKSFFEKETRCDFEIPVMMKRAWAAALEVLEVIDDICKKNDIQYFADGGTMLGAVRHNGFIPWDDDIDICLRRDEYNRLLAVLPEALPHGFVVAGMYADNTRLQKAAEVQHLRVIADETAWNYNDYLKRFHGFPFLRIGVDIFPWDYISRDEEEFKNQIEIVKFTMITLQNLDMFINDGTLERRIKSIEQVCGVSIPRDDTMTNYMWKIVDSVCSLIGREESDELGNYVYLTEEPGYRVKKECFDEVIYMPFEHIMMPVPKGYDEILTSKFGDYMKPVRAYVDHNYPFYGHMMEDLEEEIRKCGFVGSVDEFCEQVRKGEFEVR